MNREEVDRFLSESQDVIDDWNGSPDSASWTADGRHEESEVRGHYGDIMPQADRMRRALAELRLTHDPETQAQTEARMAAAWEAFHERMRPMLETYRQQVEAFQRVVLDGQIGDFRGVPVPTTSARHGRTAALAMFDEAQSIEWPGDDREPATPEEVERFRRLLRERDRRLAVGETRDLLRRFRTLDTVEGAAPIPDVVLPGRRDVWFDEHTDIENLWRQSRRGLVLWREPLTVSLRREGGAVPEPEDEVRFVEHWMRVQRFRGRFCDRQYEWPVLVTDDGRYCGPIWHRDVQPVWSHE